MDISLKYEDPIEFDRKMKADIEAAKQEIHKFFDLPNLLLSLLSDTPIQLQEIIKLLNKDAQRGKQFSAGKIVSLENLRKYHEIEQIQAERIKKFGIGQKSGDTASVREYLRKNKLYTNPKVVKNETNSFNYYKHHLKEKLQKKSIL